MPIFKSKPWPEVLIDEIEGDEVADPLIEFRRTFEIAEQES
jgi:hypothetical protein